MTGIFISHAATDEAEALEILSRLRDGGREDVFVDCAPSHGLEAGARWQSTLLDTIGECEAFLCLLSDDWIASKWCWAEYVLASKLGKRCLPLIVRPLERETLPAEMLAEHQIVDLVSDAQGWLRLESGLDAARIEATSFRLPPDRPPFPGLRALVEQDAALFFGRDPEILTALDELRRIADRPRAHLFAIIGPSGVGKSSFLRAGLLPRLRRDATRCLPLPALRPAGGILDGPNGLWTCLQDALARPEVTGQLRTDIPRARGALRAHIEDSPGALIALLTELLDASDRQIDAPSGQRRMLLLPIDQAEELFDPEHRAECDRFLGLITSDLIEHVPLSMLITTRTDAYALFQADPRFAAFRHRPFNLAPLPAHRLPSVIEGPAAQVGLSVEPALTDALVEEASGADALPIVAFALERLHRDFGADGHLTLEHYRDSGGVVGAIDAAFQQAFAKSPERGLPADPERLLDRLRHLFVPHLVRIDESGAFARRRARLAGLPDSTRTLAKLLVESRLLVLDQDLDGGGASVEIAHEALFRTWPTLTAWLNEERAFLVWRDETERARQASSAGRRDLLTGRELMIALQWRTAEPDAIAHAELDFIDASERRADAAASRVQRNRRWLNRGAVAASLLLAVLAGIAAWQATLATRAQGVAVEARLVAEERLRIARASELSLQARNVFENDSGGLSLAGLLAAESLHITPTLEARQLAADLLALSPRDHHDITARPRASKLQPSPDGRLLLDWTHVDETFPAPAEGFVVTLDPHSLAERSTRSFAGSVTSDISPGGRWLVVSGYDRQLDLIDLDDDSLVLSVPYETRVIARFDSSGQRLFVADTHGVIERREAPDWPIVERYTYPAEGSDPWRFDFSVLLTGDLLLVNDSDTFIVPTDGASPRALPHESSGESDASTVLRAIPDATGEHLLTLETDDVARLRDARSGDVLAAFAHDDTLTAAAFSIDGSRVATASEDGDVRLWRTDTYRLEHALPHDAYVNALIFSPDGSRLAVADDAGIVGLWDTASGDRSHQWVEHDEIWSLVFADEGRSLLSGSRDGQVRRYDLATQALSAHARVRGGVRSLAIDPLSGALAIAVKGTDREESWTDLRAIDSASGAPLWSTAHNGAFTSLVFSPNGKRFATTSGDTGRLDIRDASTGNVHAASEAKGYRNSLAYSADGRQLVVESDKATVVDAADGRVRFTLGEPGGVDAIGITNDRRTIVTYGDDFTFRRWDALTGEALWHRTDPDARGDIRLSDDGSRYWYTADDGFTMQVHETRTGKPVSAIPRGTLATTTMSPNGRRALLDHHDEQRDAITGELFSIVEVWNVDSAERLADIRLDRPDVLPPRFVGNDLAMIGYGLGGFDMVDARTGARLWQRDAKRGHRTSLPVLAVSGDRVLLQDDDGIEIIDSRTGARLSSLDLPIEKASIRNIDWSPEHDRVAVLSLSDEGSAMTVQVFVLTTGVESGAIQPDRMIYRMALLADPDLLLSVDAGGSVRVWRLSSGEVLYRFDHGHHADGVDVANSASRTLTWSGASMRVWDLIDGTERAQRTATGPVHTATLHPEGNRVAYVAERSQETLTGTAPDAIRLWSTDGDEPPALLPIEDTGAELRFDPTGRLLAARIGDRTVRVWDLATLRPLLTVNALPRSATSGFAFSQDGDSLFVVERAQGSYRSGIRAWDIKTGAETARSDLRGGRFQVGGTEELFVHHATGWRALELDSGDHETMPWSDLGSAIWALPGGKTLAGKNNDLIRFSNLASSETSGKKGGEVSAVIHRDDTAEDITTFAVDLSNQQIVLAQRLLDTEYRPGDVVLRDLDNGHELARVAPGMTVSVLAFVDGGRTIALLGTPGGVHTIGGGSLLFLWRWHANELERLGTDKSINDMAVSPDGSLLATAEGGRRDDGISGTVDDDPRVRIRDTRTGDTVHTIPGERPFGDVAFSPDGRQLAVRDSFDFVVYEIDTWKPVRRFTLENGMVNGQTGFAGNDWIIAPTKGGLYLFSASSDESRFLRHDGDFPSFKVSANGRTLATATRDTLHLWEVDSGTLLLQTAMKDVYDYALVGPDSRLYLSGAPSIFGGSLMRIPWKGPELIAELCRRVGRSWTDAEIEEYFDKGEGPLVDCSLAR